jgi:hypothetical protein
MPLPSRGGSVADDAATRAAGAPVAGRSAVGPRRELVLGAVTVVALSRLADAPAVWAVAALLAAAVLVGTLQVLADVERPGDSPGVAVESLLTPAVAAFACLGVIRLVPLGLGLVPALAAAALLLDRTLRTEARLAAPRRGPSEADRVRALGEAIVVSFLAFLGTAALVPGGLPEPGAGSGAPSLSEGGLVLLAGVDALVAGLLGYRVVALRVASWRSALWSAATYAGAVAIAAAGLRATDIPRLVGPALLTLVFFLWDAFHGAPPARRRDPRWIWQTALLVGLGLAVVAWNLALR